jgi:hypothetical protein
VNWRQGLLRTWLAVSIVWLTFAFWYVDVPRAASAYRNAAPSEAEYQTRVAQAVAPRDACDARAQTVDAKFDCILASKPIPLRPVTREDANEIVANFLLLALSVPAALLTTGAVVAWITRGFRAPS